MDGKTQIRLIATKLEFDLRPWLSLDGFSQAIETVSRDKSHLGPLRFFWLNGSQKNGISLYNRFSEQSFPDFEFREVSFSKMGCLIKANEPVCPTIYPQPEEEEIRRMVYQHDIDYLNNTS